MTTITTTSQIVFARRFSRRSSYCGAFISEDIVSSERAFEQQRDAGHQDQREHGKIQYVAPDRSESSFLQQQRLEAVPRVAERVDPGDDLQPPRERLNRID